MFKTKNDLSEAIRIKAIELLNARLADCIDLQTQTKQAHWNVKGPHFIALHELFDKINEEVEDYVDEIAERAMQLGGVRAQELPRRGHRGLEQILHALPRLDAEARRRVSAPARPVSRVPGAAGIFCFHICDPATIAYNGIRSARTLRAELVNAGMLKEWRE